MNISRRNFLRGLGALGLSVILERHHGGLLVPTTVRQEAVQVAREEGIVKPQWMGMDIQLEWTTHTLNLFDDFMVDFRWQGDGPIYFKLYQEGEHRSDWHVYHDDRECPSCSEKIESLPCPIGWRVVPNCERKNL